MTATPMRRAARTSSATTATDAIRFLSDISRDIALTSQDLGKSFATLLQRVASETHTDALAVWTILPADGAFTITQSVGFSSRFIRYFNQTDRIRSTYGLFADCVRSGASEAIESSADLHKLGTSRWADMFAEEHVAALLVVPMLIGDETVGVLSAMHSSAHTFDDKERFFFSVLANQIAVALKNSENYRSIEENSEVLEDQIAKLTHLQDAFQSINQYLNESADRALAFLAEYTARTFGSVGVAIFTPAHDGKTLTLTAAHGLSDAYRAFMHTNPPRLENQDTLLSLAFSTHTPQLSERIFTDDRVARQWVRMLSDDRITAEAVFSLLSGRHAFGVFVVYYDRRHPFTDEETSVLGAFSQFLGILFENQKTFSSLVVEKQRTQSIVYSLRDGLLVYDLDNVITDINPRGSEILGVNPDAMLEHQKITAEDRGFGNINMLSSIAIPDYETRIMFLTYPRDTALEVTQMPLFHESHEKTGSLRILHDVTAERRVEQLKSNFVSTATHQLRTPLTGVRWGLEKLLSDTTRLGRASHALVEQLLGTTQFMISLVNDLLNVSQIEEGKKRYRFEKEDVVSMLETVLEGFSVFVANKHLNVRVAYPENTPIPRVTVDKSMMMLALQNLTDNAIKYTPDGGSITITVKPGRASMVISIHDTGIGILREDMPFLFNKFFRGENAVRMETAGSGLGLFIAKNIVEDHNGRLTADSELGKGTTLFVQLPLEDSLLPVAHP